MVFEVKSDRLHTQGEESSTFDLLVINEYFWTVSSHIEVGVTLQTRCPRDRFVILRFWCEESVALGINGQEAVQGLFRWWKDIEGIRWLRPKRLMPS